MTDAELVTRAREGDSDAWTELHGRYAPILHGIALAKLPHGAACDVVQESFVTAWKQLKTLDDDGAFGGWLVRIARNRAIDRLRARKHFVPVPEISSRPPPTAEANEAIRAIRSLPETYSETLMLRLVEGLTGPEIAARTGMTHGSVRVNLHRGMALLREALKS